MRLSLFVLPPLLLAASPALATGGFACEATDGSRVAMGGTVGHVIGAPLIGAWLEVGEQRWATTDPEPEIAIGRSWLDEHEIRVDLVDRQAERFEAQLRVRTSEAGEARGTLVRDGRTYPVRCDLE